MQVRDIMTYGVDFVTPQDNIRSAAEKMRERSIGILPVVERDEPVGMITDRDIAIRAVAEGREWSQTTVSDVMTPEVVYCNEDTEIEEASRIMESRQIRRLLVLNLNHEVVGVLSLGDIAINMNKELAGEILQEVSSAPPSQR